MIDKRLRNEIVQRILIISAVSTCTLTSLTLEILS
jgi:hypothetical protein